MFSRLLAFGAIPAEGQPGRAEALAKIDALREADEAEGPVP